MLLLVGLQLDYNNITLWHMIGQTFSKKDGHLIQQTYKQLIQTYYQTPNPNLQHTIILLNTLISQSITHTSQLDSQQIIPKLEQLKIKAKSNEQFKQSIIKTVQHLKSPCNIPIDINIVIECVQVKELFEIVCVVVQRLIRGKFGGFGRDVGRLVREIGGVGVGGGNLVVMVDTVVEIMNAYGRQKLESGIVQIASHLLSIKFNMNQKQKPSIQKCLKIVLAACQYKTTLIQGHELFLSTILQTTPSSLLQLQDITNMCYIPQYCQQFLHPHQSKQQNNEYLSCLHVWSYSSMFCTQVTQQCVNYLEEQLKQKQKITATVQYKIYVILNNFVSVQDFTFNQAFNLPKNITEQIMKSYLNLLLYLKTHHHQEDILQIYQQLQKTCKENNIDTEAVKRLLRNLKQMSHHSHHSYSRSTAHSTSHNSLSHSTIQGQSVLQALFPKASKIPKNDDDLRILHQILVYKLKGDDSYERDNLRSLKNRALQSIRISLTQNQNLYFQKIFNSLSLKQYDSLTLKKLLQLCNTELKLNPKSASIIDIYHIAQIILDINQTQHDLLDFQQLSQIFYFCIGDQGWKKSQFMKGRALETGVCWSQVDQEEWRMYVIGRIKMVRENGRVGKKIKGMDEIVDMIGKINIGEDDGDMEIEHHQVNIQEKPQQIKNQNIIKAQQIKQQLQPEHKNKAQNTQIVKQQQTPIATPQQKTTQQINTQPKKQQNIEKDKPKIKQQRVEQAQKAGSCVKVADKKSNVKFISNIKLKYRIKQLLKKWKKRAEKSKNRKYILRQWCQTQSNYLQKLLILKQQFLLPLLQHDFITPLQGQQILPNIEPMIKLSEQMKKQTNQLLISFNPITTQLAPILKPMIDFLKIYKDYSQNYEKSKLKVIQLSEQSKFNTIVKVNMDKMLGDYLFSPVQRFLKYRLLVKQYCEKLPNQHRDKPKLVGQLEQLGKVNQEINQFMELQKRMKTMVDIQKKFGNVVTNARFFKAQFFAICIDFQIKIYVFNDLLIAAKIGLDKKQQLYSRIKLNGRSFAIKQPDCKSFSNRLYICGIDTSIHILFPTRQQCQRAYLFIQEILENLYQNQYKRMDLIYQSQSRVKQGLSSLSQIQMQAQAVQNTKYQRLQFSAYVLGMQKVLYNGSLRTYFIVRLQIAKPIDIYQIAFCELGVLEDLDKFLRQAYPKARIPTLQIKCKQTISDDLTKVSEHLCVVVQKFLNYILRNKYIAEKPQRTLLKIGLHQSLWNLLNTDIQQSQCSCSICLHSQILTSMDYYRKQIQLIQSKQYKFCILNSFNTQITIRSMMTKQIFEDLNVDGKILWANCQLRRIDYRLQEKKKLGKRISFKVQVQMLSENVVLEVKNATVYSNSRQVIEEICGRLGIETTLDLALVFTQDDQELILDDDQILYTYVKIVKQAEEQNIKKAQNANTGRFSLFDRISWGSEQDKKMKRLSICLRKIISLNQQLQQKQCSRNPQRYNLIIGQLLRKFKQQSLPLNNDDIEYLCSNIFIIQHFSSLVVQKKSYITDQKLKKYLPQSKWPLITSQFKTKISRIVQNQISIIDKIGYFHKSILNMFWNKFCFQYFVVQNTEASTLLGNYKTLQIGVCYKKVSVSRKNVVASLLEYSVKHMNYRFYADSLYIDTEEKTNCFKGNNLFVLDRLIQVYKAIHQFQYS